MEKLQIMSVDNDDWNNREHAQELLSLCESGVLEAVEVLRNLLFNFMSSDEAEDFAQTEYQIGDDENDDN